MAYEIPQIFDRELRLIKYRRARAHSPQNHFLLRHQAQDMNERLYDINRHFDRALLLTPHPLDHNALPALADKAQHIKIDFTIPQNDNDTYFDEEHFTLPDGELDLIISLHGLHGINDVIGYLVKMRRALRPDGLFLAAFLGGETLTELRQSFLQAECEMVGGASAHVHPFADLHDMGDLLTRAGFALPVADCDRLTAHYKNVFELLHDLRHMGETNILHARAKQFLRRRVLYSMADYYERHFTSDGKIPARFDFIYLAGWAPHKSQQQPLKPGSATARLADALGTKEHKI